MTADVGTVANTEDVVTDATAAATLAKSDLNFLGMLAAPEEFILRFPLFYITIFGILTAFKNNIERFAIGIPRGFAKTTFIKLLCLWYILFSKKRFILLVGASEELAKNTLADICDMLSSPNILSLFGNWEADPDRIDTQTLKVFHFRGRSIILRAIGAGTAVRGINRKNSRPDVIIMDDVQKKEESENKEISDALLKWILGTLMKARSNTGCTYIYVGNMYPTNCILEKLKNNSQWKSFIVGGLLADGTSLWEELRPAEELLAEYQSDREMGHADIFISEVLNSTDIAAASGLDLTKIPQIPEYLRDGEAEGSFIVIDPSSGKKTGDDCTINHYNVMDGIPIFDELQFGTFSPLEVIQQSIELGIRRGTRAIFVEGVAYQSTLLFWFDHWCNQQGISGFEFIELSPKGIAKNNRIKKGLIKLLKGEIYLHPAVRSPVLLQAQEWNPVKTTNTDDIIDPIGYVDEILQNHGEKIIKQIFENEDYSANAIHDDALQLPF